MEQYLTLDIGSNKATFDLSQVRKCGLIMNKKTFGTSYAVVIYYNDRPDIPEVNIEMKTESEAKKIFALTNEKLEKWAEKSNSARLKVMREELEIMREEKKVLMDVFDKFKDLMHILEDETRTSTLVAEIKDL